MKRKLFALLLAASLSFGMVSCGNSGASNSGASNSGASDSSQQSSSDISEEPAGYEGSIPDLIADIYEKVPLEMPIGEAMEIDVNDPDTLSYYLGISDGSLLTEAYFSEAMIGSQAYSLCVARLKDPADAETVAKDVLDKTNMCKWICVGATDMNVSVCGDLLLMVMIDSGLSDTACQDIPAAFAELCGKEADLTLSRTEEK